MHPDPMKRIITQLRTIAELILDPQLDRRCVHPSEEDVLMIARYHLANLLNFCEVAHVDMVIDTIDANTTW